jgi:hypothetical protein
MMKHAHEDRSDFAARVMREKGFGGKARPPVRSKIQPRPVEEILADQIAHQDSRARGLFEFGPAEKWEKR